MNKEEMIPAGFKPSPLGPIPEDWEVKELGTLGDVIQGLTYSPENICDDKGLLVLRSSNIQESQLAFEDNVYVNLPKGQYNPVCQGDILICVRNGSKILIGKCARVTKEVNGAAFGAFMTIFRSTYNDYVFHLCQTDYYYREIYRNLGATINSINGSELKHFRFPIPPATERNAIANCLSVWDNAIQKTQALIRQKELRKKWLMQQLLTGKKRLPRFDGEWKKTSAGEIFKSVSVKVNKNEELLSATQDKGIIPRSMLEARVTMPSGDLSAFKLVENGDFVISLRSFQGGLEYSEYRGIVSPAYTVLKPKQKICNEFYKQYFKSYDFVGHLAIAVIGIRDGKQVSYEDFCFVKIPFPSAEEQYAIARVLQAADKEIIMLKTKLEKLKEQKKGLMQVLLTGKNRIKVK